MSGSRSRVDELRDGVVERVTPGDAPVERDLFGAEVAAPAERSGPGRPTGSKNKSATDLRQVFALKGWTMPENVLAELGGAGDERTLIDLTLQRVLEVEAALGVLSSGKRVELFIRLLAEGRRAAEALLPYGLKKLSPDVAVNVERGLIVMPGGHQEAKGRGQYAPPALPRHIVENQGVEDIADGDDNGGDV